jgi:intracellular septation protein
VAYHYDEATWVNFKLFGLMGLTFVFALAQGAWIARKADAAADVPEGK